MFNGGFREASTGSAKLPEDDEKSFEHFLVWLYRGTIGRITENTVIKPFLDLFALAEKYDLAALMNLTMDALIQYLVAQDISLCLTNIEDIYRLTHEKSKLRIFAARSYAWVMIEQTAEEPWETKTMIPRSLHKEDILTDPFNQLRDLKNSKFKPRTGPALLFDPRTAPPCHYHTHAEGESCPSKKT